MSNLAKQFFGFLMSLTIEMLQLLINGFRASDVTDLSEI